MRRLLPPKQLGRRIHWLFLLMGLFNLFGSVPRALAAPKGTLTEHIAFAAAVAFITVWWLIGYRRRRLPLWGLPFEALAFAAVALAQHDYVPTVGLMFGGVMFRGLFGSWRHVLGFVVTIFAGSATGVMLGDADHFGPFLVQSAGVPALAIFTAVIAVSTRRQEASSARERVFAQVGTTLATTADPEVIYRTATDAAYEIIGSEPTGWAAISVTGGEPGRQQVVILAGAAPAELAGASIDSAAMTDCLALPLATDKHVFGTLMVHGSPTELKESGNSLRALAGQTVLGLVNADHAASLRHQAFHDTLTGLANRALLQDHLGQAVARARRGSPLAVLLIDLDGFKGINDTYGHATGDFLLVNVAQRLRDAVRGSDTAARLGGDEFAVVLDGMESAADALDVAGRILASVQAPLASADGVDVSPRASIGVAIFDGHASADDLMHEADTAMYAAKKAGKGRVGHLDGEGRTVLLGAPMR